MHGRPVPAARHGAPRYAASTPEGLPCPTGGGAGTDMEPDDRDAHGMDGDDEDRDDKMLGELLRAHATRHRAGPALEAGIRAEIALQSAAAPRPPRPARWRWPAWGLAAAGFACGMLATLAVVLFAGHGGGTGGLENELVASHIRALMPGHLTDVASTDQHTVKPWFQGRLDYSPPVRDLAADGFPLVGGRLDYVAGRPVAALVYRRRQHFINVFVWPAAADTRAELAEHQGYHVLHWRAQGMQYWAVSDVNAEDLRALGRLLR